MCNVFLLLKEISLIYEPINFFFYQLINQVDKFFLNINFISYMYDCFGKNIGISWLHERERTKKKLSRKEHPLDVR